MEANQLLVNGVRPWEFSWRISPGQWAELEVVLAAPHRRGDIVEVKLGDNVWRGVVTKVAGHHTGRSVYTLVDERSLPLALS